MGTFSYTLSEEGAGCLSGRTPGGTKAVTVAELRGRGLTVIAATLEGIIPHHVCGVAHPGVKRRYFSLKPKQCEE
jgi:hypothetical protein